MKYFFVTFLIAVFSLNLGAQENPVRIDVEKGKSSIRFYATNDLSVTQQVELKILEIKGLKGYSKPIVKSVPPGEKRLMVSLITNGAYSYKTSYTYIGKPSQAEQYALKKKKEEKLMKDNEDIMQGIVVFEKNGCSRCNLATSFLLDNDIDFKIIDVSEKNGKGNRLMWDLIRNDGHNGGQILTPVFLVDGKLSHTHKDLNMFLAGLVDE